MGEALPDHALVFDIDAVVSDHAQSEGSARSGESRARAYLNADVKVGGADETVAKGGWEAVGLFEKDGVSVRAFPQPTPSLPEIEGLQFIEHGQGVTEPHAAGKAKFVPPANIHRNEREIQNDCYCLHYPSFKLSNILTALALTSSLSFLIPHRLVYLITSDSPPEIEVPQLP